MELVLINAISLFKEKYIRLSENLNILEVGLKSITINPSAQQIPKLESAINKNQPDGGLRIRKCMNEQCIGFYKLNDDGEPWVNCAKCGEIVHFQEQAHKVMKSNEQCVTCYGFFVKVLCYIYIYI